MDQLKQEMRRKKELERRLRLGDASRGDEDAAEQDNVRRMLCRASQPLSACSCGLHRVTRLGHAAYVHFQAELVIVTVDPC